ncbi:Ifi-6-16 multi-domain protein [Pyrenophora teres f. maculata]|nr:Ifi-6-16 multi-domain protein [Pyrenophora teres f. maculata]
MANISWIAAWFTVKIMMFSAHTTAPTGEQQPESSHSYDAENKEDGHEANVKDFLDEDDKQDSHKATVEDGSDDEDSESDEDFPEEATDADSSGINSTNNSIRNFWAATRRAAVSKATELAAQAKDAMFNAIKKIKELGFVGTAKAIGNWMKEHPWETAAIVTMVALACTAIGLAVVGFGASGVAAGSIAAGIQAGIGNVVAGSLFATCTSAMMGGSGALIIFGGVGVGTFATVAVALTAWRGFKSQRERALVKTRNPTTHSNTSGKAVDNAIFWTICAAAAAVYYMKSWWRGNSSRKRRSRSD